ncbi:MAG: hypothetical protein JXR11_12765 [Balneola sp.]
MTDIIEIENYLKENGYRRSTPFILSVILFVFSFTVIQDLKIGLIIWVSATILEFLVWFILTRIPKGNKNKSILIAINSDERSERNVFLKDFLETFEELNNQDEELKLEVIKLPRYYSKKVDASNWLEYSDRSRCDFVLWGNVKIRNVKGKETIALNLKSGLRHRPTDENLSKILQDEMARTGAHQIFLDINNELIETHLLAQWINIYFKYLSIIASNINGDYNFSLLQIPKLENLINKSSNKNGSILTIRSRLKQRRLEALENKINFLYQGWRNTREIATFKEIFNASKKALSLKVSSDYITFIAMYEVINNNAFNKAIKLLNPFTKEVIIRLNIAFCYCLKGNYLKAISLYKSIDFSTTDISIVEQIEEFSIWYHQEKNNNDVYLILCLINLYGKEDFLRAKKDYEVFYHNAKNSKEGEKALKKLKRLIIPKNS